MEANEKYCMLIGKRRCPSANIDAEDMDTNMEWV